MTLAVKRSIPRAAMLNARHCAWQPCCFPHALATNATRRGACAQAHCDQPMKLERMGDSTNEPISI
ncbi:hypothetical protein [Xanthomonas vesicatoria]|uniref:hypothetical protein n=1 Tax=Xanthomonas vesicatoria TaxID=56460 RepID=UPI001E2E8D2E|nr:hypothetical protein [Xanthomonas vesicatoria]MCC8679973.1 hypothetical protein [Xanthomonas vesicatoria]MCC8684153.1 hypothetical protein [Xanthomonas vesicatoria]